MLRVGLIGCGRIARTHIPYIRAYEGAHIVGVCDDVPAPAHDLARHFHIADVYEDVTALLREQRPDVVHITTPPQTHAALALAAMEAGAHVLVEKPMAVTLAEAERMRDAATRAGVQVCVNHNRLFDPVVLEARRMLADGILGDLIGVEAWQGFARPDVEQLYGRKADGHWVYTLPGGIVQDIAPHAIALVLSFLQQPRLLSVATKRTGMVSDMPFEEARVVFEGQHGFGSLSVSLAAQPYLNMLYIYGSQASVQLNLNNMTLLRYREQRLPKLVAKSWFNIDQALQLVGKTLRTGSQVLTGRLRLFPGMGTLIQQYYTCLERGGEPPVGLEAGCEVVRVLERLSQHAREHATQRESC